MKNYGARKATEFTKKQINVIWAKAKNGELKVEKWFISELYDLADFYGYDDNRSVEESEKDVLKILDAVFANNAEQAQELINNTAEKWFHLFGKKTQNKCDRTAFVA